MALYVREFSTHAELEDFLQDLVVGTQPIDPMVPVNVRNKTLTFTTPAKTVTFPDTAEYEQATPNKIVAYINSASGLNGLHASIRQYGHGRGGRDSRIALVNAGDVITGGTAAVLLGLPSAPSTTVGAGAIALASVAQVYMSGSAYGVVYDA